MPLTLIIYSIMNPLESVLRTNNTCINEIYFITDISQPVSFTNSL